MVTAYFVALLTGTLILIGWLALTNTKDSGPIVQSLTKLAICLLFLLCAMHNSLPETVMSQVLKFAG